jgi:hypothetical protein
MRYTVVWRDTALQQLATIWMAAADRAAVNHAVDDVDTELADDPDQKGEDYFGDRYILNAVMWALYHIYSDDRMVHVLQVGRPGIDLPHDDTP